MNNRGKYAANNGHIPASLRDKEHLHKLYVVDEMSARDIAQAHGVSKPTALRFLSAAGVPLRHGSAAKDTKGYRRKMSGAAHPNYKDGKRAVVSGWGYRRVQLYGDERVGHRCTTQGRIPEHVFVFERFLGRPLTTKEVVHHVDFDRLNNSIENLMLFPSQSEHNRYHKFLERVGAWALGVLPEKPVFDFQSGTVIGTQT
jgi:hypothetical protein